MDMVSGKAAITIRDIADALEMSHATVSRALSDHPKINKETKARVRAKAQEMGYVPNGSARNMRGLHSPLVGLIVPDIQNDFYASIAKIVADAAAARGFQLALSVTEDNAEREMRDLRALIVARAAGIIITPTASPAAETLDLLAGVRAVQLVRQDQRIEREAVIVDDHSGTRAAAQHLIDYGHRDIAYVGVTTDLSCGKDRLSGFQAALAERHLDASRVALGHPRPEFSRHAVHALMTGRRRPSALVMGSSSLTLGALMALRSMNIRWPEDVSIVGYGDPVWFDLIGDGLTTVSLPVQDMGRYIISLLLTPGGPEEVARGTEGIAASRFAPSLVVRRSTRPLS
jgi:DNA-binding LacI/PurR family transcriptional regulator